MSVHNVKKFTRTPLYLKLAQDLKAEITSGKIPVGARLPTELELAERYSASRYTVRAAISELQTMGLVSRKKKSGTKVESASTTSAYKQTVGSIEDLTAFGASHARKIQASEEVTATKKLADKLGCSIGKEWLKLTSLRYNNSDTELPMSITEIYIDSKFKDVENIALKNPDQLVSNIIEEKYGKAISEVRQEIIPILLSKNQAKALNASEGEPALQIIRSYIDTANEVFEITVTTHPADRYTFVTKLRRDTSAT
jgi:DNA-binding GntR family transcriptional regulator